MNAPALIVDGVSKRFHRPGHAAKVAVDAVSLALNRGGSLGLVGESGSGKTTLARIIAGLLDADQGTIKVNGTDRAARVRGRSARLRRAAAVQMVFQDPYVSLDPRMTTAGCLAGALRLHGERDPSARRARVDALLDQVGLGPREAEALPRELSGGQRQRVAVARALAVDPSVLIMDEAVSALDVSVQAQILELVQRLRIEREIAVLFVSHDLAVVRHVCEDVMVMRDGAVVEAGATRELLGGPKHPYSRLLVAAAPGPGWNPDEVVRLRRELQSSVDGR